MKTLYISSEAHPFSKVGGLSDVAGSLPIELNKDGVECLLCIPYTREVQSKNFSFETVLESEDVIFNGSTYKCNLLKSYFPNTKIPVYFIDNENYFHNENVYETDKSFDFVRFIFLTKSILTLLPKVHNDISVVHFNDYFGALTPIYLKNPELYHLNKALSSAKSYLTIHNISSQGIAPFNLIQQEFPDAGVFHLDLNGNVNCLMEAIIYVDGVNTVSHTYRNELLTTEYSFGLDEYLKNKGDKFIGILNGVNYDEFNPVNDDLVEFKYNFNHLEEKEKNKTALQNQLGLSLDPKVPLMSMVTRLVEQKGIDLIMDVFEQFMALDLQLVILGTGEIKYMQFFRDMIDRYKGKYSACLIFDEILEHKVYAASDLYLMPSKFEPGGLSDLIALKYGCLPIVRNTGGLADAIIDIDQNKSQANGFVFPDYNSPEMLNKIKEGVEIYSNKDVWVNMLKNAMDADFSWSISARKYIEAYKSLVNE